MLWGLWACLAWALWFVGLSHMGSGVCGPVSHGLWFVGLSHMGSQLVCVTDQGDTVTSRKLEGGDLLVALQVLHLVVRWRTVLGCPLVCVVPCVWFIRWYALQRLTFLFTILTRRCVGHLLGSSLPGVLGGC